MACESEQEREADAREDAAEAREELQERSEEDAPDSAAEMKEDVGVHSMEDDEAESPEELRKKLDLHPNAQPSSRIWAVQHHSLLPNTEMDSAASQPALDADMDRASCRFCQLRRWAHLS